MFNSPLVSSSAAFTSSRGGRMECRLFIKHTTRPKPPDVARVEDAAASCSVDLHVDYMYTYTGTFTCAINDSLKPAAFSVAPDL